MNFTTGAEASSTMKRPLKSSSKVSSQSGDCEGWTNGAAGAAEAGRPTTKTIAANVAEQTRWVVCFRMFSFLRFGIGSPLNRIVPLYFRCKYRFSASLSESFKARS